MCAMGSVRSMAHIGGCGRNSPTSALSTIKFASPQRNETAKAKADKANLKGKIERGSSALSVLSFFVVWREDSQTLMPRDSMST